MSEELPKVENSGRVEVGSAETESAEVEVREAEARKKCFKNILQWRPNLSAEEQQAIVRDMSRGRTRAWSAYDGESVRISKVAVVNGIIRISFQMDEPVVNFDEIIIV